MPFPAPRLSVPRIATALAAAIILPAVQTPAWTPIPLPGDILFENVRFHDGRLHGGWQGAVSSIDVGTTWRTEALPPSFDLSSFTIVEGMSGMWGFQSTNGVHRWNRDAWVQWNEGLPTLRDGTHYVYLASNDERLLLTAIDGRKDSCHYWERGIADAAWKDGVPRATRGCNPLTVVPVRRGRFAGSGNGHRDTVGWIDTAGVLHRAQGEVDSVASIWVVGAVGDTAVAIGQDASSRSRILRSIDGGRTWKHVMALAETTGSPFLFQAGPLFFVGRTGSGTMHRSRDAGSTWESMAIPASLTWMGDATGTGDTLVIRGQAGPMRSMDRGKSWESFPQQENRGYAWALAGTGSGLLVLQQSWKGRDLIALEGIGQASRNVAVMRRAREFLPFGSGILIAARDTVFRFVEGRSGLDTMPMPAKLGTDSLELATDGHRLVTSFGGVLGFSMDTARSWTFTGLTSGFTTALALAGDVVLEARSLDRVGMGGGIWATRDSGKSWERCRFAETTIRDLRMAGDTVLAATDSGLFASSDTGKSWRVIRPAGLPDRLLATSLAVDGRDVAAVLYARDASGLPGSAWVARSSDRGASWNAQPADALAPNLVAFGPQGLYVSTWNRGLWLWDGSATIGGIRREFAGGRRPVSACVRRQSDGIRLTYAFANAGEARVVLYDAQGREVYSRPFAAERQGELVLPALGPRLLLGRVQGPGGAAVVRIAPDFLTR